MKQKMRVMTEKPLNAETPLENLRTWVTDNAVFSSATRASLWMRPLSS
ncbi:hypothetical protein ACFL2S_02595 [Thermodesulfobacteriota bacterium]